MKNDKKTTIMDIAQHAGVSPSTVSRVLNTNSARISEKTRSRIKKIAKKLNYTPNKMAQSLVTGRTNAIGIVVPDLYNPFLTEVLGEIEVRLTALGYESRILQFHNKIEELEERISQLITDRVKAIIICPSDLCLNPPQIYQEIINTHRKSLPVVLVSDRFFSHNQYFVTGDNVLGAKMAV